MEDKITKVVKKLILPRFPEIVDFDVEKMDVDYDSWMLNFYLKSMDNTDMYYFSELNNEMSNLTRNILGLRSYQVLHRILLKSDDDLPFDEKMGDNIRERTFSENVDEMDLKWHWDEQDRIVTPLHKTDWMLQFDNELPINLIEGKEYFIPVGVYHRVIKGSGDLKLQVKFL